MFRSRDVEEFWHPQGRATRSAGWADLGVPAGRMTCPNNQRPIGLLCWEPRLIHSVDLQCLRSPHERFHPQRRGHCAGVLDQPYRFFSGALGTLR